MSLDHDAARDDAQRQRVSRDRRRGDGGHTRRLRIDALLLAEARAETERP